MKVPPSSEFTIHALPPQPKLTSPTSDKQAQLQNQNQTWGTLDLFLLCVQRNCTPCQLNDTSMNSIKNHMWLVLNYFTSFSKTFSSFSSCSLSFPLLLILCYNSCLSFSGARSSMRTRCARSSGRGRPTMSPWGSVPTMRAGLSSRSDIKLIQICFWVDFSTHFLLQGDYNNYQCGLTVAAATAEDNGEWECDFESYVKVATFL